MSHGACRRLAAGCCSVSRLANIRTFSGRNLSASGAVKDAGGKRKAFDASLLQFLVCPLSKKALRYDETTNELINDELGIAYPVLDGIPNMIPQDARMIQKTEEGADKPTPS